MTSPLALPSTVLVGELCDLIDASRAAAARSLNSELVWLYWQVGHRIRHYVVGEGRAAYGDQLVAAVAASLSAEYGRGFSKRNLHHMLRFAEVFPEPGIVHALRAQLSWTHLREIIALDDPLRRRFYVELCRLEAWSTRTLQEKIAGMLYERTVIAKRPEAVVQQALTALGKDGGCRSIGADDYYLDLLFFHRPLRALVAVELKLGRFDARDKGQMELYLRWLDKHERQPDENQPLGLILCADRNDEQIELLQLTDGSIRVASYLTELPPRALLEKKLLEAIAHARAHVEATPKAGEPR